MSVVKFPCKSKRQPSALAAAAPNPKRERMVARAERVVELLSTRFIRDDWSFDKNRATRFLHCLRTLDFKDVKDGNSPEFAEILDWVSDHGQSLNWILGGEPSPDSMICMLAQYSPGRRQTRVLRGA
jgi:hypothetical protein